MFIVHDYTVGIQYTLLLGAINVSVNLPYTNLSILSIKIVCFYLHPYTLASNWKKIYVHNK